MNVIEDSFHIDVENENKAYFWYNQKSMKFIALKKIGSDFELNEQLADDSMNVFFNKERSNIIPKVYERLKKLEENLAKCVYSEEDMEENGKKMKNFECQLLVYFGALLVFMNFLIIGVILFTKRLVFGLLFLINLLIVPFVFILRKLAKFHKKENSKNSNKKLSKENFKEILLDEFSKSHQLTLAILFDQPQEKQQTSNKIDLVRSNINTSQNEQISTQQSNKSTTPTNCPYYPMLKFTFSLQKNSTKKNFHLKNLSEIEDNCEVPDDEDMQMTMHLRTVSKPITFGMMRDLNRDLTLKRVAVEESGGTDIRTSTMFTVFESQSKFLPDGN